MFWNPWPTWTRLVDGQRDKLLKVAQSNGSEGRPSWPKTPKDHWGDLSATATSNAGLGLVLGPFGLNRYLRSLNWANAFSPLASSYRMSKPWTRHSLGLPIPAPTEKRTTPLINAKRSDWVYYLDARKSRLTQSTRTISNNINVRQLNHIPSCLWLCLCFSLWSWWPSCLWSWWSLETKKL